MKSRNIRKEKPRKPVEESVKQHSNRIPFTDKDRGIDYYLVQDNYETVVYLKETNEPVGRYKAATRSWKNPVLGLLSHNVKLKVYSLYA